MKSLTRNRVFLLVMGSDLLQNMGIWVRNMALLFFVMGKTGGDPVAVSLLTVFEYLPIFLFSIVGGLMADRWNPKHTMIGADLLSIGSILTIMLIVHSGNWQAVFLATLISAIMTQFSQPSSAKLFKEYVPEEQVGTAIGLSQSLNSLFMIAGPVLGTMVYTKLGLMASFISLIGIFSLSAFLLSFLPAIKKEASERAGIRYELKAGLSYLLKNSGLINVMLCFAIFGFGAGLIQPLEVFILTDRLHLDKENLQWFSALGGGGLLVGGLMTAALVAKLDVRKVLIGVVLFEAIAVVIEALSPWAVLTGSLRFLAGMMAAALQVGLGTYMMRVVAAEYIGRINGMMTPLIAGPMLIGSAVSGTLMAGTSVTFVYILGGAIIGLGIIPALRLDPVSRTRTELT